jgi:hypothetical protein
LTRLYAGPVAIWATWADFGSWPTRPFTVLPHMRHDYRGCFLPTSIYSGCGVTLVFTSYLLVAFSFALVLPPSLLQFSFKLHSLLVGVMEGEGFPILDVVGDESKVSLSEVSMKVPLSKVSTTGSSSDDSSEAVTSDDAETQVEDTLVLDPHEAVRSYDFGASSVTVGRIHQLESLGYFAEGSVHEPGEEIIVELADDKAIVFYGYFAMGPRMPPHPAFIEILLKYRVQLH